MTEFHTPPLHITVDIGLGKNLWGQKFPDYLDRNDTQGIAVTGFISRKEAYEMAGITVDDVDVAQVYDLVTLPFFLVESLGLCEIGEAGKCFMNGDFSLEGKDTCKYRWGQHCKGTCIRC